VVFSLSVDFTYLTGKRVFIFGDATHAIAAARMAKNELGFDVVGLGTYSREFARAVRAEAEALGIEALITDDYLDVEKAIAALQPESDSRHADGAPYRQAYGASLRGDLSARACAGLPARYSPQMGFEGANVIFDTWVHPLMMGLEEHLIHMFREDHEFHDYASPRIWHGAGHARQQPRVEVTARCCRSSADDGWLGAGSRKRTDENSLLCARESATQHRTFRHRTRRPSDHCRDTVYDAKAHFSSIGPV